MTKPLLNSLKFELHWRWEKLWKFGEVLWNHSRSARWNDKNPFPWWKKGKKLAQPLNWIFILFCTWSFVVMANGEYALASSRHIKHCHLLQCRKAGVGNKTLQIFSLTVPACVCVCLNRKPRIYLWFALAKSTKHYSRYDQKLSLCWNRD